MKTFEAGFTSQLLLLALAFTTTVHGESFSVASPTEFNVAVKRLKAGDELVLAAGVWKDVELHIDGNGSSQHPIRVRGAEPGKTVLTGASRVRLSGQHLILEGLVLDSIQGSKADWLEFRYDSKKLASHCIVQDCCFLEKGTTNEAASEVRWIGLYGERNTLRRCRLEGKVTKGATVVVWLGDKNPGRHHLESNYFGPRPNLGKNGGETLRIGDSNTSMQSANCIVEKNLFFQCDGETECVSNKSCDNIYRANTFLEVRGTLTLRHGNRCLVESNVFIGNKRSQTGGIRVIGEDHRILNNYLQELEGDGFRTAICLLRGYPESPLNGYFPVQRAVVEGNTVVHCKHSLLIGYNDTKKATVAPSHCSFRNNVIIARQGKPAIEIDAPATASTFEGNRVQADLLGIEATPGIELVKKLSFNRPIPIARSQVGPHWEKP